MELIDGSLAAREEADMRAVAGVGVLLIMRKPHPETRARLAIGERVGQIFHDALVAQRAENRVVELPRARHRRRRRTRDEAWEQSPCGGAANSYAFVRRVKRKATLASSISRATPPASTDAPPASSSLSRRIKRKTARTVTVCEHSQFAAFAVTLVSFGGSSAPSNEATDKKPLARRAAMFHPRGQFLADIAALVERDAREVRRGRHRARRFCPGRNPLLPARRVRGGARDRHPRRPSARPNPSAGRRDDPMPEASGRRMPCSALSSQPAKTARSSRGAISIFARRRYIESRLRNASRDACRAIEQHVAAVGEQKEIEQDLALGREQGGVERRGLAEVADIVGDQALQEVACFGPRDGKDGAVVEAGGGHSEEVILVGPVAKPWLPGLGCQLWRLVLLLPRGQLLGYSCA